MDGVTSCGIDCISALGRARLDGHGRDCVVSSPLLPAVGWSSFSRLRPAGSRSLDACAATCRLPVGLSSCAFWCCSKASFCAFFWSWYFAGSLYFGLVLRWGLVLWPGTFAEGGILEGYFGPKKGCMRQLAETQKHMTSPWRHWSARPGAVSLLCCAGSAIARAMAF